MPNEQEWDYILFESNEDERYQKQFKSNAEVIHKTLRPSNNNPIEYLNISALFKKGLQKGLLLEEVSYSYSIYIGTHRNKGPPDPEED